MNREIVTDKTAKIVSSEDERLILVDSDDNQTGELSKAECHDGAGRLHRAFSLFLFNEDGELLLQQRAPGKRLWPGFWSNSCCSHPRHGETMEIAVARRLQDELHVQATLEYVYKFSYQAKFEDFGSERELCHVYLGTLDSEARRNETEIEAIRYVSTNELDEAFRTTPEQFTPWFKMEWARLNEDFADTLARYTNKR
jgi:isopentenyl-diphosphate delta-isomerase